MEDGSTEDPTLDEFLSAQKEIKRKRSLHNNRKKKIMQRRSKARQFIGPYQPHRSRKIVDNSTPGPGEYDTKPTFDLSSRHGTFGRQRRHITEKVRQIDKRDICHADIGKLKRNGKHGYINRGKYKSYFDTVREVSKRPGPGYYDSGEQDGFTNPLRRNTSLPRSERKLMKKVKKTNKPGPGFYAPDITDSELQFSTKRKQKRVVFPVSPRFQKMPLSPA